MIGSLNHLTLSVRDLERSFVFYRDVLQFRPLARWRSGAYLLAGEETWICLSLDDRARAQPLPEYTHVAFSVPQTGFASAIERLRSAGAAEWKDNTSEGDSFYFLDPDGHKLELHVGDWRSRLEACRKAPYDDMVFF
ncbi:MAG: glutathione transferase [Polyangiaceae bacterium]|nr:glutathione transferase [Polyangiaceae bacterium]